MLFFVILLMSLTIRWQKNQFVFYRPCVVKPLPHSVPTDRAVMLHKAFLIVQPVCLARLQYNAVRERGTACGWHSAEYGVTGNSPAARLKNLPRRRSLHRPARSEELRIEKVGLPHCGSSLRSESRIEVAL
jgi:hypothetical protein